MIKMNGKDVGGFEGKSVSELLDAHGYQISRIAVEYNYEILSKSKYGETQIKDGDIIEVVSFVGGG